MISCPVCGSCPVRSMEGGPSVTVRCACRRMSFTPFFGLSEGVWTFRISDDEEGPFLRTIFEGAAAYMARRGPANPLYGDDAEAVAERFVERALASSVLEA